MHAVDRKLHPRRGESAIRIKDRDLTRTDLISSFVQVKQNVLFIEVHLSHPKLILVEGAK